jgi:hypothetical protein
MKMLLNGLSFILFATQIVTTPVKKDNDNDANKRFIVVFKKNGNPENTETHKRTISEKVSQIRKDAAVKRFFTFDMPGCNGFIASIPTSMINSLRVIIFKTYILG